MTSDDVVVVPLSVARRLAALRPLALRWSRDAGVPLHPELVAALDALEVGRRDVEYGGGSAAVPPRPGADWISVMTYAAAVGITDRAARKRCLAGTVRAARDRRGHWRIAPEELPS